MHLGEPAGQAESSPATWLQHPSINNVDFFPLSPNRGAEMHGYCLASVFHNRGAENCLEDNAHRIGKTSCRIGHLRQEAPDASIPAGASRNRASSSESPPEHQEGQQNQS